MRNCKTLNLEMTINIDKNLSSHMCKIKIVHFCNLLIHANNAVMVPKLCTSKEVLKCKCYTWQSVIGM